MIDILAYQPENGDWTTALNQAVQDCIEWGVREIFFPIENEVYSFKSKPNPFGVGIVLRGESPRQFLVRDYQPSGAPGSAESSFLVWDGSAYDGDPNSNKGGGMVNLGVGAGNGTTQGAAILITGTSTTNRPGYMDFENVVVSVPDGSSGSWAFNVLVKGQFVTTAGSQGMRDICFRNLYCFRATGENVQVTNGVHVRFQGLLVSDGGVGNSNAGVRINGLGSATSNSTQITLSDCDIEGTLSLVDCSRVYASGYIHRVNTSTSAMQCKVSGLVNVNNAAPGTVVV